MDMTSTRLAGIAVASVSGARIGHAGICVLIAVTMAGCGRIGLNDPLAGSSSPTRTTYEPLPAAPAAPVTSSALPPPPVVTAPTATAPTPVDPSQPGQPPAGTAAGIPIASATPPKAAEPVVSTDKGPAIGRGELAGGWRISSGSDNCQLFITLTSWSGGYRASSKGCNSAELQRISAWDVSGKQVALKSGDGAIVATLTSAGQEKFAGTTASKQAISLSR